MKEKILPITKQILIAIARHASDSLQAGLEFAPHYGFNKLIFGSSASQKRAERWQEQKQLRRALQDLEKRKYIETRNHGGKIFYLLTSKGTTEAFLSKIKSRKTKIIPNQFCIVCFDVPVVVNKTRRALRHFLKIANFKKLQHSVWYTNKDIFDDLKTYIKDIDAADWVRVIKASRID